ncbi:hypothetical protein CRE_16690 [Caenorhabditis remanei]|uniref:Receptor L-domain domain-containing protein n=1 Tax=Caenorhabditis remanei TaxID=31234 RepID=E3MB39_CAERE|nr:hypothetical protein CRE_16690 [Caenorhabditis remanei]
MYIIFLLIHFLFPTNGREQGPPPEDSGLFNEFEYYYDIYINESMIALPDVDPKYEIVQAVYISGNLKLSERELQIFFRNINTFRYGIRVNNTNLESLSFLKPYIVNNLDETVNSVEIINNQNLKTIGIDFENCNFCYNNILIINNPKLDLKEECDGIIMRYSSYRTIFGNHVDCGCEIKGDFNKFLTTMSPSCWMLFGNVTIDQNSNLALLTEKMVNVTRINGGLSVTNTIFTNLSFLSSIEIIQIDAYKSQYLANIDIINNTNLLTLGMKAKRDGLYLTIRDNPKLCITSQDLDNLFYGLSLDSNLDIKLCFNNETSSYWCQLPDSGDLNDLPDGCHNLTGNLVLDNNFNFANSYKLYDLQLIYGSLTITNSSLRTTNMFPSLQRIRSIEDNTIPLNVLNNTKLRKLFSGFTFKGIESGMAPTVENNINLPVYVVFCSFIKTRKAAIIKKNLQNCGDGSNIPVPKYDRTPYNIDVFRGVPIYFDVSHGSENPGGSGMLNNPWDRNSTDVDYSYDVETTTENSEKAVSFLFVTAYVISVIFSSF